MAAHDEFERGLPRALRGYQPEAVRELLAELVACCDALLRERDDERDWTSLLELELKALAERAGELAAELEQFHAREELIFETLVTAKKTASEMRDAAKRSASDSLRKARNQADRIVEEAERRRTRLEAEIHGLERLAAEDRAEVATLLQSLLDQVTAARDSGSPSADRESRPVPEPRGERFNPGDYVRLTEPTLGMPEGASREFWEVSTSEAGQVVDHDAAADLVEVIFEHNSGENGRHVIRLVVEPARLEGAEQPAPADTSVAS